MTTHPTATSISVWDPQIVRRAIWDSLAQARPATMARNPVMFVVEIGSVLTTLATRPGRCDRRTPGLGFELQITAWLWLTVLFANFAEAMAEGRGKAQADTLRKAKTETIAQAASARTAHTRRCRPRSCARATSSGWPPARSFRPTATSSKASHRSTRAPSPASPPRSSASRAAIARLSPAARASCRTGSGSP